MQSNLKKSASYANISIFSKLRLISFPFFFTNDIDHLNRQSPWLPWPYYILYVSNNFYQWVHSKLCIIIEIITDTQLQYLKGHYTTQSPQKSGLSRHDLGRAREFSWTKSLHLHWPKSIFLHSMNFVGKIMCRYHIPTELYVIICALKKKANLGLVPLQSRLVALSQQTGWHPLLMYFN